LRDVCNLPESASTSAAKSAPLNQAGGGGMRCPFCREDNDRVVDSRSGEDGITIRRRRECLACKRRFTTYERVEENPLRVIKKDGRRVPYEREKIRRGIEKACWNLNVSIEHIDKMVSAVESEAFEKYDREVPSSYLGELLMRELRKVNQVAYVRFASVYKEFKDVSEFMEVLEEFMKGRGSLPPGLQGHFTETKG
jgi:transcriptional repressor NrdR